MRKPSAKSIRSLPPVEPTQGEVYLETMKNTKKNLLTLLGIALGPSFDPKAAYTTEIGRAVIVIDSQERDHVFVIGKTGKTGYRSVEMKPFTPPGSHLAAVAQVPQFQNCYTSQFDFNDPTFSGLGAMQPMGISGVMMRALTPSEIALVSRISSILGENFGGQFEV